MAGSGSEGALLTRIGAEQWCDMVAKLFTADVAEVRPHRWDRLHLGAGVGNEIHRTTGTARLRAGTRQWSLVVKIFILDPDTVDPDRTRPDGREYWKREWHVYRSEWQQHLHGPLRAARCLGSGEFNADAAQVAWIALEDLSPFDQRPWPMPLFGEVASHIGEFTGAFVDPPAAADWLSHHWHADLIENVAPALESLPGLAGHPLVDRVYPRHVVESLLVIWERRDRLLAVQHHHTRALTHNDLFPRNVFLRRTPRATYSVAVDWANCGIAPIGQELTALILASPVFAEIRAAQWDLLERECFTCYLTGLRRAGWTGPADDVRLGYLASIMLQALLAVPPLLALAQSTPQLDSIVPGFGCAVGDYLDRMAGAYHFAHQRVPQTWALLGL